MPSVASPISVLTTAAASGAAAASAAGQPAGGSGFGDALAALLAALSQSVEGGAGGKGQGKTAAKADDGNANGQGQDLTALAASLLAALQAAQSTQTPPPATTQTQPDLSGLKDIVEQALAEVGNQSGPGQQARLEALRARFDKLEQAVAGDAAANGTPEPQAFGEARSLLNALINRAPAVLADASLSTAPAATPNPTTTATAQAPATPPVATSVASDVTTTADTAPPAAPPPPTDNPAPPLLALAAQTNTPPPAPPAASQAPPPPANSRAQGVQSAKPASPPGLTVAAAHANDESEVAEPTPPAQSPTTSTQKDVAEFGARLAAHDAAAEAPQPEPLHTDSTPVQTPPAAQLQAAAQPQAPIVLADPSAGAPEATAYLAAQIVKQLGAKATQFQIQLHPADLGRVDVQIQIQQDGRLNAQLAFDNPAAAADFRGRADELRRSLEQAGFQLSDNALSFNDSSANAFNQSPGQGAGQGQAGWTAQGRLRAFDGAETVVQTADAPPSPTLSRAAGGLDMRV